MKDATNRHPPLLPLAALDALWFQVAGTLCNLRCRHCFISCAPDNHSFGFMTLAQVRQHLAESVALGVREYYFTGGEPFLNPDIYEMLAATLALGPAPVLTNATRFTPANVARLAALRDASLYSLELRVSLDGFTAETNDPIRGPGTFEQAKRGVELLAGAGFLPIITAMRSWPSDQDETVLAGFREQLTAAGCSRVRLKLLPALRLGAEAKRDHGYGEDEFLTEEMLMGYDPRQLLCHNSRIVSDRGVHVCPILIDQPAGWLGATLAEGLQPARLSHPACTTCYAYGAICSNAGGLGLETARPPGNLPS